MNLELVPRDELLDELARRYDTLVVGMALMQEPKGGRGRMVWFHGDPMTALGLNRILEYEMLKIIKEGEVIDSEQTGSGGGQ